MKRLRNIYQNFGFNVKIFPKLIAKKGIGKFNKFTPTAVKSGDFLSAQRGPTFLMVCSFPLKVFTQGQKFGMTLQIEKAGVKVYKIASSYFKFSTSF